MKRRLQNAFCEKNVLRFLGDYEDTDFTDWTRIDTDFFVGRRVFRPPIKTKRLIFTKYINQNQFLL